MFGLLLAIAAPALAAEPAGALTDRALVEAIQTYQRHAELPLPLPGPKRRAQLLSGKLVRMRLPSAEGQPVGAMALQITDLSLAELWIGTVDEDMGNGADEVLSHHMPRTGGEMFRWYGYVDMPSPVTDRHFLIQTTVNARLHSATEGQMWARHWRMEPGGEATMRAEVARGAVEGVTPDRFEDAIWVPHNTGSWVFIDLPGGKSLLGYQATASLGGSFPDSLVNRYVYWGLERIMEEMLGQARRARGHYRAGHAPIEGGDGRPLPAFP